jgi:putative cardiolipin synthase
MSAAKERRASQIDMPHTTTIANPTQALAREHPGQSGVLALRDGHDAFAARAQLADAAHHGIDCQCYIWRNDMSGTLLLDALRRAADRGVRIRLLLDDHNTEGLDVLLAALDAHANIEVRLFNPHRMRRWRLVGLLLDFARLNRRMHNKSFTVDGAVTIVGGRNVGDEYFGAHREFSFIDLDVLAVGSVVPTVARDFERYWVSKSAFPVRRLIPAASESALSVLRTTADELIRSPAARAYSEGIRASQWVSELLAGSLPLTWTRARLVSDPPEKGLGLAGRRKLLVRRLERILGKPERELLVISAYFVPTRRGMRLLVGLAKRGVKVTVLTKSLEATDVTVVHAGYARYRKALLRNGVTLYEMKRLTALPKGREWRAGDSSGSSLHAKVFCADRARVFIGSFNFDARSVRLNTEMGLVIEGAPFAESVAGEGLTQDIPRQAYAVRLGNSGNLEWIEQAPGGEIIHTREPNASLNRRAFAFALSWLRIDWLL